VRKKTSLPMISEMVVSSRKKLRPLNIKETNKLYHSWFSELDLDDVVRFDFPYPLSIRLGLNWLDHTYLYQVENHLEFSAFQREDSDPLKSIIVKPFYFDDNRWVNSDIDTDADNIFFSVPKYFCDGFEIGNEVEYEMIDQKLVDDNLQERYVVCRNV